jgi:hypothetical protein
MTVVSNKRLTGNPWRQLECEWVLRWERSLSDLPDSFTLNLQDWLLTHKRSIEVRAPEEEKTK